jgi:hypothetical protein
MKLHEVLENTANEYALKKLADVRFVAKDEDTEAGMVYQGNILGKENQPVLPVGLGLVVTSSPADAFAIVEVGENDALPPDMMSADALDLLAGIVQYRQGRAGILWCNAGQLGLVAGNVLVNRANRYRISLQKEQDNKSWDQASRFITWADTTPVKLYKGRKGRVVMDWLRAALGTQSDAGETADEQEGQGSAAQGQ